MMGFGVAQTAVRIEPASVREQARAHDVLTRVSRPRLTGSAGAAEVDRYLRGEFEHLGYEVRELPFSFSAFPGKWGVSLAGLVFAVFGMASVGLAGAHHAGSALLLFLLGAVAIGLGARYTRAAIRRLPWGRSHGVNWLVTRPGTHPRYVMAAHRDSKSQPVPLLVRAGAIAGGLVVALAILLFDLVAFFASPRAHLGPIAWVLALATAAVGAVLLLCFVRDDSPGALDNGTGVAALVALAARERDHGDIGFLLTDAEELGLAGASAACSELEPVRGIINLDGLDDRGPFHVIDRHGYPRRGMAPHLVAALLTAADQLGVRARRRSLPSGLLVDHIPFVEAGFAAVTIMRGSARSLRRVHRPEDVPALLSGEGITATVTLVSAALGLLRADAARA